MKTNKSNKSVEFIRLNLKIGKFTYKNSKWLKELKPFIIWDRISVNFLSTDEFDKLSKIHSIEKGVYSLKYKFISDHKVDDSLIENINKLKLKNVRFNNYSPKLGFDYEKILLNLPSNMKVSLSSKSYKKLSSSFTFKNTFVMIIQKGRENPILLYWGSISYHFNEAQKFKNIWWSVGYGRNKYSNLNLMHFKNPQYFEFEDFFQVTDSEEYWLHSEIFPAYNSKVLKDSEVIIPLKCLHSSTFDLNNKFWKKEQVERISTIIPKLSHSELNIKVNCDEYILRINKLLTKNLENCKYHLVCDRINFSNEMRDTIISVASAIKVTSLKINIDKSDIIFYEDYTIIYKLLNLPNIQENITELNLGYLPRDKKTNIIESWDLFTKFKRLTRDSMNQILKSMYEDED